MFVGNVCFQVDMGNVNPRVMQLIEMYIILKYATSLFWIILELYKMHIDRFIYYVFDRKKLGVLNMLQQYSKKNVILCGNQIISFTSSN